MTAAHSDNRAPVFIVGCPRSGTTLLQRMLDAHPAVAVAGETHFIGRFWLHRERYGDLTDDVHLERLLDDIVSMPEFSEMALESGAFRAEARGRERTYASLMGLLLSMFGARHGAQLVGEKTPDHLVYAPVLLEFFPSARFVHIVRDPRAVVNSWRNVPWSSASLFGDAEIWRKYMRYARRFPDPVQRAMFTLSYEALVGDPEAQLPLLCRFLDLDFDPGMLRYHENAAKGVSVAREPWKAEATRPLKPERARRWQSELSPPMIATIEGTVWPEMKRRGYQPQTHAVRLVPAVASAMMRRVLSRVGRRAAAGLNKSMGT